MKEGLISGPWNGTDHCFFIQRPFSLELTGEEKEGVKDTTYAATELKGKGGNVVFTQGRHSVMQVEFSTYASTIQAGLDMKKAGYTQYKKDGRYTKRGRLNT